MPIYEYRCLKCEHKMEALQKISAAPLVDCPACGTPNLNKLISAASFRLKGAGWYETDFKTGGKKQLAESESASDKGTESNKSNGDKQEKSDTKTTDSPKTATDSTKTTTDSPRSESNNPKNSESKTSSRNSRKRNSRERHK